MNERKIIEKLMQELKESEHTIHILMNTISEKDRQISDLAATMRVMSETIDEMKEYIACLSDCNCDCCECEDDCCCDEFSCEECDCDDDSCDCPEAAPCGRVDDERCCVFCEKMSSENSEVKEDSDEACEDCEDELDEDDEFFDFIGNLISELEKNPNLTDFEKDGFEVHIKRIK